MRKTEKTESTRQIVENIFMRHPNWNAQQVFDEYCLIVPVKLQVSHISSIQKHLEVVKNNHKELLENGLDEPWTMGTFFQNGFEKEYSKLTTQDNLAILKVRKMQNSRIDISKKMSIRQALWIARLWAIVDEMHTDTKERAFWLWMYSFQYAIREKVSKLKKVDFNSRKLDDALAEGHEKFKEIYEKDSLSNWRNYERFYRTHIFNELGDENNVKDGE